MNKFGEEVYINTLCGYENVKPIYVIKGYEIFNKITGAKKKVSIMKQNGYPYVTLEQIGKSYGKKCTMHRLLALTYIDNKNHEVVEHINDIRSDYRIDNLKPSTQKENNKSAWKNGCFKNESRDFIVELIDGSIHIGNMRDLSCKLNIPRQTLYCIFYRKTPGIIIKSVVEFKSTDYRKDSER